MLEYRYTTLKNKIKEWKVKTSYSAKQKMISFTIHDRVLIF